MLSVLFGRRQLLRAEHKFLQKRHIFNVNWICLHEEKNNLNVSAISINLSGFFIFRNLKLPLLSSLGSIDPPVHLITFLFSLADVRAGVVRTRIASTFLRKH